MKRRIPIFGILIILIGISLTPLNQGVTIRETYRPISSRGILYVGGSGPNNYTSIQYAIDDASEGDIVFVYEGIYNELIVINTTISLIGEEKGATIINGSQNADIIIINADNVNISGFTVQNSGYSYKGIWASSEYCNISDNIFNKDYYGIYAESTGNHTITKNIFYSHRHRCISTSYSHNNIISRNVFSKTGYTVIDMGYCNFSVISDNYFSMAGDGLYTYYCNNLTISNNTMIRDTYRDAFTFIYTNYCTISNNNIISWERGIWLEYSNYNNISNNKISDSYYEGIYSRRNNEYNTFFNNALSYNQRGIHLYEQSHKNIIYNNNFSSNNYGIDIKYNSPNNNNKLYHNIFKDNNVNANDGGTDTIWNDSYPSGGNYWSHYTGEDNDRDGIGDTPLNISGGGGNKDYYPLMYPWGEQRPVANYTYLEEFGGYVFNASLSYDRDGEVVSFEWDFGDGTTEQGMTASHAYNESGLYNITLIITDDKGYKGNHTKTINANKNYPPDIPSVDGPSSGGWGKPYYFTFQSSDNEDSEIWYYINWGDEHNTGWMGPYVSGYELSDTHTWTQKETFTIRCKAKDMYGSVSDWAEFEITIPRTRTVSYLWYQWFLERFSLLEKLIDILYLF